MQPRCPALFWLAICVGVSACAVAILGPPVVQAIGLDQLFPWLVFGRFEADAKVREQIYDKSNDKAALASTHELIRRAGFEYENYYALSDDGYITQLIRVINPLADASQLRYPPVMIAHGQTSNSGNFVLQSNKQHKPMPWPRPSAPKQGDGKKRKAVEAGGFFAWDKLLALKGGKSDNWEREFGAQSSNRSLALMLANNGFDVWLSSNRGVDRNNQGFLGTESVERLVERRHIESRIRNMTDGEFALLQKRTRDSYWAYTLDDQIAHEMPSQISTVLEVTGAKKITLVGYSNSALTTLAMLSVRHDIAKYVDATVSIAPVVYYTKMGGWFNWVASEVAKLIPKALDAELFLTDKMAELLRRISLRACTPIAVRYTLCKFLFDAAFGSSAQFTTNIELPLFGHLFRPTSWKCMGQHLQIVGSQRLSKFNYGPEKNKDFYGTIEPPEYNITSIAASVHIGLVSGDKDLFANPATLERVRKELAPRGAPAFNLAIKEYNHIDLTNAFDVDVRVNLPVLDYLNKRADACERELPDQVAQEQANYSDDDEAAMRAAPDDQLDGELD